MFTLIETPLFSSLRKDYWTEDQFGEFTAWLANNPESGAVVRGSGGVRKVRWARPGSGKSGGFRVIYYNRLQGGEIWLLVVYAKNEADSIPGHVLKAIKQEIEQ
ncbi:MAG: transcriptional regulator [Gammaproteobacteria bacterium]|nr:MAG: transcriptional regulator [Gammaproteobacteria bacterium]